MSNNSARIMTNEVLIREFKFDDIEVEGLIAIKVKYADIEQADDKGNYTIKTSTDFVVNVKAGLEDDNVVIKETKIEVDRIKQEVSKAIEDTVRDRIQKAYDKMLESVMKDEGKINGVMN
ncbi:MAG: hypothetical protein AB7E45_00300 [Candidatus Caldatribacteriota bacterium]|jgi:predicted  nucleic acid-binding Zn-ribbon protein